MSDTKKAGGCGCGGKCGNTKCKKCSAAAKLNVPAQTPNPAPAPAPADADAKKSKFGCGCNGGKK